MKTENMTKSERLAYWNEVLETWEASGMGLESWCLQNDFNYYKVRYWKRRCRETVSPKKAFIEVQDTSTEYSSIVVCVGGVEVKVAAGFNPSLLTSVVRALGAL